MNFSRGKINRSVMENLNYCDEYNKILSIYNIYNIILPCTYFFQEYFAFH